MKTFIIAEAGVNHNGSIEMAKQLVDVAVEAGVDCIKFQTFKSENLVSRTAPRADYQRKNTSCDDSQFEMLKKLELSYDEFRILKDYCEERGIIFLSTAFDNESADFLANLGMKLWKIPSGEITNLPLLEKIAATGQPVILSTGMAELWEIEQTVKVLREGGCGELSILHCTTEYPAPYNDINLKAIENLRAHFGVRVGYSDHSAGISVPIAAVALGAEIIEKHFTLDKNLEGPDHKASLEPDELRLMVESIRQVELSIGSAEKKPADSELKNRNIARKCIVAGKAIKKGELLSADNLAAKRAGEGISPMQWYSVLGTEAIRDFDRDEPIEI